jgi:hypothetical protein
MSVELFNQSLVSELGDNTRLGGGIPGQVGADNILVSNFKAQIGKHFIRSAGNVAVVAGSQDIIFSSDFGTTDYSLTVFDINGIGVGVTAQASDKFTIDSLGSGVINYIAIKNI